MRPGPTCDAPSGCLLERELVLDKVLERLTRFSSQVTGRRRRLRVACAMRPTVKLPWAARNLVLAMNVAIYSSVVIPALQQFQHSL
jgi:hypothetical protein